MDFILLYVRKHLLLIFIVFLVFDIIILKIIKRINTKNTHFVLFSRKKYSIKFYKIKKRTSNDEIIKLIEDYKKTEDDKNDNE